MAQKAIQGGTRGRVNAEFMVQHSAPGGLRSDIQGMRALAVLLVLIFHIWPAWLPGGYVGVDVFFVISGFLITRILVDEAADTGTISLLGFYSRRIRRLLPAATLVLVSVGLLSLYCLPEFRWAEVARHLAASALYVENLNLYVESTDYLSADAPRSPFQHYWSLSIEEQFYLVMPLLLLTVANVLRGGAFRVGAVALMALITVGSLYWSITLTAKDAAAAYFLTTTRVWELGLGGLLATALSRVTLGVMPGVILGWAGLAAVVASALLLTPESLFPGYLSLAPTLGCAAILLSGFQPSGFGVGRVLSIAPMRYLGDISYSLYLWHWPLVVFAEIALLRRLTLLEGAGLAAICIGLAALTKHYVEDRFRYGATSAGRFRAVQASGGLIGAALASAALVWAAPNFAPMPFLDETPIVADAAVSAEPPQESAEPLVSEAGVESAVPVESGVCQGQACAAPRELPAPMLHPGARALLADVPVSHPPLPFVPVLRNILSDNAAVYRDGCHLARGDATPRPCVYGPSDGQPSQHTIVLVGDSHAAQWLPALQDIANGRPWTIVTHTKSSCPFIDAPIVTRQGRYEDCILWNEQVLADIVARSPDLVFTAMARNYMIEEARGAQNNLELLGQGLNRTWSTLLRNRIPVLAMRSTPDLQQSVPDCVASHQDDYAACAVTRQVAFAAPDPILVGVRLTDGVRLVDLTGGACRTDMCHPIVGNVLAYRDRTHYSATFARSFAPFLEPFVVESLRAPG